MEVLPNRLDKRGRKNSQAIRIENIPSPQDSTLDEAFALMEWAKEYYKECAKEHKRKARAIDLRITRGL